MYAMEISGAFLVRRALACERAGSVCGVGAVTLFSRGVCGEYAKVASCSCGPSIVPVE